MRHALTAVLIGGLVSGAPGTANAQEEVITLDGARIRGGQEAPLVLYLVPWKPPEAKALDRPSEELVLAPPITPLRRSEFQRLMSYHQQFQVHLDTNRNRPLR